MRCKVFSVPLESEKALDRERKLNEFLQTTNVKRIFASVANQPEGLMWSVMFFYEDGAAATRQDRVQAAYDAKAQPTYDTQAQPIQKPAGGAEPAADSGSVLNRDQVRSIVALKKWRADQAAQEGVPLYMVAQNRWLEEMVRMPNRSLDDLMKINGLGEWRVQKYGGKILEVLNTASAAKRSWPASSYSAGRA